jgi:hypothetical protein
MADYIDKAYPSVPLQLRVWDCQEKRWLENATDKVAALTDGSDRYAVCMCLGQVDVKGQEIYVDQIVRYAYDWNFEGGYEPHNRVFKKDTKKHKGYQLGIVKFHAETACYVIWPYRNTCRADNLLIEVVGDIHSNPELAATIEYPYDEKGNHIKK